MRQTTMSHSFDTYKHIKALVAQGMNENQAELVVSTIVESRDFDLSKLVTREEFSEFKSYAREQFTKIESEILLIKKDIDHIKETMATKEDLASVKYDILKWILPFVLGNTIAILGIIVALFFR